MSRNEAHLFVDIKQAADWPYGVENIITLSKAIFLMVTEHNVLGIQRLVGANIIFVLISCMSEDSTSHFLLHRARLV